MTLGCVEFAVPGDGLEDKLRALEVHEMWLELVNKGIGKKQLEHILGILPSFNTSIKSVQAYRLHNLRMFSARDGDGKAAVRHVEETVRIASAVGAQNVVVVATYGKPTIKNPKRKCVELFRRFGRLAGELGVTVSIEALSGKRTTFLPSVREIHSLVRDVNSEHVRLMMDTEHIHANGEDVVKTILEYAAEAAELHLRDTNSKPPGRGKIDFSSVVRACRRFKGLRCLEYRLGANPRADLDHACEVVRMSNV